MARVKPDAQLKDRTSRAKLAIQGQPYWMVLEKGRSLGYRKGKKGGQWVARYYDPLLKQQKVYQPLGSADDHADPDGVTVLSFAQAQTAARKWFEQAYHLATGEMIRAGKLTVANVVETYIQDRIRHGAKTAERMRYDFNAHVIPALGDIAIERLTRKRIEDWMDAMAATPVKRRGKAGAAPSTDTEKRSRKATTNRVWTLLRAALNLAAAENGFSAEAWTGVRTFRVTQLARIRFLSIDEQVRFVGACPSDDFRALVQGALFTGARESELFDLKVSDFDPLNGTVFIEFSKTGPSRHITLTQEGVNFFKIKCANRDSELKLFPRTCYHRIDKRSRGVWTKSEICRTMNEACMTAQITRLKFHELRHTYASTLINAGIPLVFVAQQLGHVDTRMVEKHYGHLCHTAKAEAVRRLAPVLGI